MMLGRWVSFWNCLILGAMLNCRGVKQIKDSEIMAISSTSCVPEDAGRQGPGMLCEGQNLPLHRGQSFRCRNGLSRKILPWIRFLDSGFWMWWVPINLSLIFLWISMKYSVCIWDQHELYKVIDLFGRGSPTWQAGFLICKPPCLKWDSRIETVGTLTIKNPGTWLFSSLFLFKLL